MRHRLFDVTRRKLTSAHRLVQERRLVRVIRKRYFSGLPDFSTELKEGRLLEALRAEFFPDPPIFGLDGDFSSPEARLLKECFDKAKANKVTLPHNIRRVSGLSGQKYRSFINCLVGALPDARYLEIGSYLGSTVVAALFGNSAQATCIDNWSQFGGPRERFFANLRLASPETNSVVVLEKDFRDVDYSVIGKFNVYLYDGPHDETDQHDAMVLPQAALDPTFFLIVDDWNGGAVRRGTITGLKEAGCVIVAAIEIRTTLDGTQPIRRTGRQGDWHNGYFLAVVRRIAPQNAGP
jgi:hypothetical protein